LTYKTTTIESLPIGLKLMGGLDWEFSENLGITLTGIVGRQDTKSRLTDKKPVILGVFLGISFSTALFQKLSQTVPATAKFPSTSNQQ
jgi:hypothetical protein